MSLPRYSAKRDTAEPDIITALERVGAEVWVMDFPVDLLVRFRERWHLLEVKTPYGKAKKARKDKRQKEQINFIETTKTPIVTTPLEALRAVGAIA